MSDGGVHGGVLEQLGLAPGDAAPVGGRGRGRGRAVGRGCRGSERERIAELERENRELRRANEILKTAAAFFGAELDRRQKK